MRSDGTVLVAALGLNLVRLDGCSAHEKSAAMNRLWGAEMKIHLHAMIVMCGAAGFFCGGECGRRTIADWLATRVVCGSASG